MEETKEKQNAQPKQLSYDDLRNIAGQLQQQNMQLRRALEELNYKNMFERLHYLFEVMKYPHMFNEEFVEKCSREIETIITIPDSSDSEAENKPVEE